MTRCEQSCVLRAEVSETVANLRAKCLNSIGMLRESRVHALPSSHRLMSTSKRKESSFMRYGSDLVVEFLRDAGIEFVALNPGASFRGLHDSLLNPGAPETIVAL